MKHLICWIFAGLLVLNAGVAKADLVLGNGIPNVDYNTVTGSLSFTSDGIPIALILVETAEANFVSTVSDPDGAAGTTWNPAVYSGGMNWSTVSFANTAFLEPGTWTIATLVPGLTAADFQTTNGNHVFYSDNAGVSGVTSINFFTPVAVPEPSAFAVIGLATSSLLMRRRRA